MNKKPDCQGIHADYANENTNFVNTFLYVIRLLKRPK